MRSSLLFVLFLSFSNIGFAQEYAKESKRVVLSSLSFETGFYYNDFDGSLDSFKKFAPDSKILNKDYTGYTASSGYNGSSNSVYSLLVGFDILAADKSTYQTNPMFNIGLGYYVTTPLENSLGLQEVTRIDTTMIGGATFYLDSTRTRTSNFKIDSKQIRLQGEFLLRSSQASRLSIHGGIGFSLGYSVSTAFRTLETDWSWEETRDTNGGYVESNLGYFDSEFEVYNSQGHFASSLSIPLGLGLRLSKKSALLSRFKLYIEVSPELRWTSIPEIGLVSQQRNRYTGGLEFKI